MSCLTNEYSVIILPMAKETKERSFADTQDFVRKVTEEAYQGERAVDENELDRTKPYTIWHGQSYQADYTLHNVRKDEIIPLVAMPIDAKPQAATTVGKRRPNATLLYLYDPDAVLPNIANQYGVTRQCVSLDTFNHIQDLHSIASPDLESVYPPYTLPTHKVIPIVVRKRKSVALGGKILEIAEAVKRGETTQELIKQYGFRAVGQSRKKLPTWGEAAPPRFTRDYKPLVAEIANPETPRERLASLITALENPTIIANRKDLFVSIKELRNLAIGIWNPLKINEDYATLKNAGQLVHTFSRKTVDKQGRVKMQNCYFGLVRELDENIRLLRERHQQQAIQPDSQ